MILENKTKSEKNSKNIIYGGIAGTFSRSFVAPFDKIKIIMQMDNSKGNFLSYVKKDISNGGLKQLWKGNIMNSARILINGIQFYTYNYYKLEKLINKYI